ncbi:hypothetical protein CQW23_06666 [Capsicum baccatum]|uniref:Uncharacterized protein n=1 Tax=Capsicum baccatum TaxID=33114 RepID=A0A2G2X3Y5_CAPBA|nr:hypothetical protein CQW23_06666 [Capsicum baccatum]
MQSLISDHRDEICAIHEKVSSLEVFVKNFEKNNVSGEMTDFEVEVKEVANDVECTIQLRLTETVLGKNKSQKKKARRRFRQSLKQVAEDMDRIWKESTKIQDKGKQVSKESLVHDFSSSINDILNVNNNMVGRDDQKEHLLEDLTGSYSGEPKVIPIVGMAGIGKTTLAKEVYNHESILRRFDDRAWATVSQQHNRKEILLGLLRTTIKMDDTVKTKSEEELADMLQKSLKRKRYLIVLDDIWSCEVWDGVRQCFPTEHNAGSRIVLTTRNNEVACYAGTESISTQMDFMDQDESWNLFKSAAFSSEALPYEFDTVGKQIADDCHGLPLTIVVVAGLLKSKRAIEDWRSVAKDVKSFITNDPDERCSRVLGLSYNHLTSDLKTCLLHFGVFPEDSEIGVKKLMRIWMAEGFLKLENDLEGEAEKCLKKLVDRGLVIICKKSLDGTKIRSCKVHDLIYGLCLREIQRENIFIMNNTVLGVSHSKKQPFGLYRALLTPVHRQLRDQDNNVLLKRTHSIFSFHLEDSIFSVLKLKLIRVKLLKVLELRHIEVDNFPVQILSLIWLRYLSLPFRDFLDIPPEICRLWNLRTFIVQGPSKLVEVTFGKEIWGLMQLRHLKLPTIFLPNPLSVSVDKGSHMGFSNLQTTSYLSLDCCSKEVIMGIQNVKKLGIRGYETDSNSIRDSGFLNNLVHLQQLETLSFIGCFPLLPSSAKAFPATLKKLKLGETYISWSYLDIVAELPNLEVLKLMVDACDGEEWHPNVRGFTRLKLLLIEDYYLKYWKATNDNFPVLERLVLRSYYNLKEMPIEFAEIHTLQLIELTRCLRVTPRKSRAWISL